MGLLDFLFGGKYDADIASNAAAHYARLRGPFNKYDHKRAAAAAQARAEKLQDLRDRGKLTDVSDTSYGYKH